MARLVYVVFYIIVLLLMGYWVSLDVDYLSSRLDAAVVEKFHTLERAAAGELSD